jgi:hypothetical protein
MNWFSNKNATVADNDTFVTLIRLAQEDAVVRKQLLTILNLPSQQRNVLLTILIDDMKSKSAPSEFVAAIACLLGEEVADTAHKMISKEKWKDKDCA